MTHVAQKAAERNMAAFIKRDPTDVTIQNRKSFTTGTGGRKLVSDGDPFEESVRFVPSVSTSEKQATRITADGRTVLPNWMVVASPDTDIAVGAKLTTVDGSFEVVHRARVPSWRVTFEAIQDGPS